MRYLLDTTWAAEYLRGRSAFVSAIEERRNEGLAISVVTLAELFSGVARQFVLFEAQPFHDIKQDTLEGSPGTGGR